MEEQNKIVAVSAAISTSARDELVRIAAKEDRTFSYIVRRIIENYLNRRARAEQKKRKAS